MGHGPDFSVVALNADEAARMQDLEPPVAPAVINFGPDNIGAFGPDETTDLKTLQHDAIGPEYRKPHSGGWICVDGRGPEGEAGVDSEELDAQIPGSKPIADTAADMQSPKAVKLRLSERIAANTTNDVQRGREITVHGDDHAGKAGCAANTKMRLTLKYNGEKVDLVVPTAWELTKMFGLDQPPFGVKREDLVEAVIAGAKNAADAEVWDVTPEEVVDIAVRNGAQYKPVKGHHTERFSGVTLDEDEIFDNRMFARQHSHENSKGEVIEDEAFAAAIGTYVHTVVPERVAAGDTPHEAALHVAGVFLFTVGLHKVIGNEDLSGLALGEAHPVVLPV